MNSAYCKKEVHDFLPDFVYALIIVGAYQSGMCHLTLTSFSWSTEEIVVDKMHT
jgi:hypothetical protein